MRRDVAIVQKTIPSYRVPIFTRLSGEFDLIVCHSRKNKGRNNEVASRLDFPDLYLRSCYYRNTDTALIQNLFHLLFRVRPKVIICDFALGFTSFWILLLTRRIFGFRLAIWTHGVKGNRLESPFSSVRDRVRLCLMNRVDAIVTYSARRTTILKQHLRDPGKVFLATNTLDTERLLSLHAEFAKTGTEQIRNILGFTHRFNLVFIGRLLPDKGVDVLITSFAQICHKHDVALHIVGPGDRQNLEKMVSENNLPVRFHGPVFDEREAGRILFASDLMIMPNAVGLSIVHAFSFGTPILTVETSITGPSVVYHSPEIEFLKPGVNGIYCQKDELAKALDDVLSDPEGLETMKEAALRTANEECSVHHMIDGFKACVDYLMPGSD